MRNNECKKITEPVCNDIITSVTSEYIPNKNCKVYHASTPKIVIGNGEIGVITLNNPKKSGVNLYLISATFINLDNVNVLLNIYQDSQVKGCLESDLFIQPTDLSCSGSTAPSAIFTYGSNAYVYGGYDINTHPIRRFSEYVIHYDSLYMFPPGSNRIYQMNTVNRNDEAIVRASFEWLEEKIINK